LATRGRLGGQYRVSASNKRCDFRAPGASIARRGVGLRAQLVMEGHGCQALRPIPSSPRIDGSAGSFFSRKNRGIPTGRADSTFWLRRKGSWPIHHGFSIIGNRMNARSGLSWGCEREKNFWCSFIEVWQALPLAGPERLVDLAHSAPRAIRPALQPRPRRPAFLDPRQGRWQKPDCRLRPISRPARSAGSRDYAVLLETWRCNPRKRYENRPLPMNVALDVLGRAVIPVHYSAVTNLGPCLHPSRMAPGWICSGTDPAQGTSPPTASTWATENLRIVWLQAPRPAISAAGRPGFSTTSKVDARLARVAFDQFDHGSGPRRAKTPRSPGSGAIRHGGPFVHRAGSATLASKPSMVSTSGRASTKQQAPA